MESESTYNNDPQVDEINYDWFYESLNFKEWVTIACAKKAYDEIRENNP